MISLDQDANLTSQDCIDVACFLAATRQEKAKVFFEKALEIDPKNSLAMANLAGILANNGNPDKGRSMCLEALAIDPSNALAWQHLGVIAQRKNEFNEAKVFLETGLKYNQTVPDFYLNMSINSQYRGEWQEAIEWYGKSLAIRPNDPNVLMSIGMVEMLRGNWDIGFPLYEQRLKWKSPFPVDLPQWDGQASDLNGKNVLIVCEQGVGDAFMFIRYIRYLKLIFPTVKLSLFCTDLMRPVMERWGDIDKFYSPQDIVIPQHDFQMAIMSLPWFFRQAGHEFIVPLVKPNITSLEDSYTGRKRVGLCWQGNPKHPNDRFRSIKLSEMLQIANTRVTSELYYHSFQFQPSVEDKVCFEDVIQHGDHLCALDWMRDAGKLTQMNVVITVDTAIAHLAATLGVRTWTWLPKYGDWRWSLDGETTPWYPTMKLFRQSKLGNWDDVIAKTITELETL